MLKQDAKWMRANGQIGFELADAFRGKPYEGVTEAVVFYNVDHDEICLYAWNDERVLAYPVDRKWLKSIKMEMDGAEKMRAAAKRMRALDPEPKRA